MEILPPYLATDFEIFRALGRSWGPMPLVARVRDAEHGKRYGALIMLRLPQLEEPFALILAAYNAADPLMARRYHSSALDIVMDSFALGIEDEELLKAIRDYFEVAAKKAADSFSWANPGDVWAYAGLRDRLLMSDDAEGTMLYPRFLNIGGGTKLSRDPRSKIKVEKARARKAPRPSAILEPFLAAATGLLRAAGNSQFESLPARSVSRPRHLRRAS
jgi:hypothetical protein